MENEDVNLQDPQSTDPATPEENPVEVPGSKTDSALLLKALQEERAKRKELEAELALKTTTSDDEDFSDEGKFLKQQIDDQNKKIDSLLQDKTRDSIVSEYPLLKEKWHEFETFSQDPENQGMSLKTAAKAFMIENGLLETKPRLGLEKSTGGPRVPVNQDMTVEDIKKLRETNFRKYTEMLEKGQIKI
jgi:hypothetical protein